MKEKGDNFIPSVVLAIAAHALLFLAFAWFVARGNLLVVRPGITPVAVELIDEGSRAEGKGPGNGGAPGPRPPQTARVRAPAPQKPVPMPAPPAQPPRAAPPAPTPPSPSSTAPVSTPSPQTAQPTVEAPAAQGLQPGGQPSAGNGLPGGEGSGDAGQAQTGSGGSPGGSAAGPPGEVMTDIDPVPIEPIVALYPAIARRLGQHGLTKVEADIDAKGVVISERITLSSGFASLDGAALDAVKKARFMPAIKNGKAVESRYLIPIRFVLPQD